jgi:hypothetical protein
MDERRTNGVRSVFLGRERVVRYIEFMGKICGLLAIAACLTMASCGGSDDGPRTTTTGGAVKLGPAVSGTTKLPGMLTTPPPWPANDAELQQRLRRIGLPALTVEGQELHIHQHLDVLVDDELVTVPANIGIDSGQAFISPLHTHDTSGIIHVESEEVRDFTLGEFFDVWGVRLDRKCIGGLCTGAGKQLRAWVNGQAVNADPARIVLTEHQEIVLAYGTPDQTSEPFRGAYNFPPGL